MKKETGKPVAKTDNKPLSGDLFSDIRAFIQTARQNVAVTVNSGLTILYWQIGSRIRQDILKKKRAEYGEEILPALSAKLVREFGKGFTEKNLRRMVQFAEVFSDMEIIVTLSRQLSWSHFVAILPPSFGKWRALSWSLGLGSRLLPAKKGSPWITKTIILICSFFTANSIDSLRLN
jgi:hypothetical protein